MTENEKRKAKKNNMAYWDDIDECCYEIVKNISASSQVSIDEDALEESITEIGAEIRDTIIKELEKIGGVFPFIDEDY